jgi:hypothetical protein
LPPFTLPFLATLLGASMCACAHTPAGADTPIKENTTMPMEERSSTPPQPRHDAAAALSNVLELIRGSKSVRDFTAERLTAVTGLPMNFDGARFGAGETLTPEWRYGFYVNPDAMNGPLFMFYFDPVDSNATPPATLICKFDFDAFASELEGMGFEQEVRYGEHNRIVAYDFHRSGMWVSVGADGEDNEPAEKLAHRCIRSITIK